MTINHLSDWYNLLTLLYALLAIAGLMITFKLKTMNEENNLTIGQNEHELLQCLVLNLFTAPLLMT